MSETVESPEERDARLTGKRVFFPEPPVEPFLRELDEFVRGELNETCRKMGIPISPRGYKEVSPFRYSILMGQIGDLARYIYHDTDINPTAREHGSPAEEDDLFGHILIHVMAMAAARGRNIERGVESAMQSLREKDYVKRVPVDSENPTGLVAYWPDHGLTIRGILVRNEQENARLLEVAHKDPRDGSTRMILLKTHPRAEDTPELLSPYVDVVLAEQGGSMCHAAIVCREKQKPVIVGTGAITWPSGTLVEVSADGKIRRLKE